MILPPDQRQGAAQRARVRERPKVTSAIVLFQAGEREPWNGIVKIHLEQEEPFIVTKTDIVTRVKFLDELALEQQGFRFASHQVEIEVANALDQRFEFQVPTHAARGLEVVAHALAQIAGFAHVDYAAQPIAHQVNARLMRQYTELFANVFDRCHPPLNYMLKAVSCKLGRGNLVRTRSTALEQFSKRKWDAVERVL